MQTSGFSFVFLFGQHDAFSGCGAKNPPRQQEVVSVFCYCLLLWTHLFLRILSKTTTSTAIDSLF